ncbi:hypothetical protein HDU76_000297 [Blyttiomyces sp. JEL0837]|nr:hypothetical protein HDU76_000297 [Blyttiomyces sp. JEL0837]
MSNSSLDSKQPLIKEIAPGFFNIRASFKVILGLAEIGTHMSLIRLSTGRFLAIDTLDPTPQLKSEIDALTENGKLIDAVIATHPFHTMYCKAFYQAYPTPKYYGTPRHLKGIKEVLQAGDVNEESVRKLYEPEVEMRIPDGSEFVDPQPPSYNHFSNVFVFHKASKVIHVDDTIMFGDKPGFIQRLMGLTDGSMLFHPTMTSVGLQPTPEAPLQFQSWMRKLLCDWDFDHLASAHNGVKIGGAKAMVEELLKNSEAALKNIGERKATDRSAWVEAWDKANLCECG